MSTPLNFLQASVRADELVANEKLAIGTNSQTSELHIKADAPEIRLEDRVGAEASETATRIYADSGNTYIQSGVNFTDGSSSNIVFGSMGNATEFVNIGAHGIETTGNLFVNNLQFTQTQGLDQILNVSNTTSNIMTLTNTSDNTLNVTGGITAGKIGIGTTDFNRLLYLYSTNNGVTVTREDGRYIGHDIVDLNTAENANQYNYIMAGTIPGSVSKGSVHFINGPDRTADNGSNAYVIRNDSGRLVLGTQYDVGEIVRSTNIWQAQPGSVEKYVGYLLYNYSNALTGSYLYQNIYNAPLAPTENILQTWQRAVQICRQGSLVSIAGYVVFKTNTTTPYLYFSWAQLGFDRPHNVNTVWNGSTVTMTASSDANYVSISSVLISKICT
jgi:hypothetical protein